MPAATTTDDDDDETNVDEAETHSPEAEPHSTSLSQYTFEDSDNEDDPLDTDESTTYVEKEKQYENLKSAGILKIWQDTQVKMELLKNEKPLHGYFDDQFASEVKAVRKQGKADLADANLKSLEKVKNLAEEFRKQSFTAFELNVLSGACDIEIAISTRPKRIVSLQHDSDHLITLYEAKTQAETVAKMKASMEGAARRASPARTIAKKKK